MGAVTIAAAHQRKASSCHLNEINILLVKILQSAIETPEHLFEEYSKVWNEQFLFCDGSIQHFYKIRDEFNNGDDSAAKLLYLIARCVKGSVRYGSNGKFNHSPDKRKNGTKPSTLLLRLYGISSLLKDKTNFSAVDYRKIFEMAKEGDEIKDKGAVTDESSVTDGMNLYPRSNYVEFRWGYSQDSEENHIKGYYGEKPRGKIIIPTKTTVMHNFVFYECTELTAVDLTGCSALTKIGRDAFEECKALKEVNLTVCSKVTDIDLSRTGIKSIDLSPCPKPTNISF